MKTAKIIVVILIVGAVIGWARHGHDVGHIAKSLPFCGGHKPGVYDLGGLAMLGLCLWGLSRLRNAGKSDDSDDESSMAEAEEAAQADEESVDQSNEDPANHGGGQNSP